MSQLVKIERQMCDRHEFQLAVKLENQKIFPFYVFTNFNTSKIVASMENEWEGCNYVEIEGIEKTAFHVRDSVLSCDYCREKQETNLAGYYTMYIVFESPTDIRVCCNVHHCRKGNYCYTFNEQSYGFRNKVEIKSLIESPEHYAVFHYFFNHSYAYWLNNFINTGITWNDIKNEINPSQGGSCWNGNFLNWDLKHLEGEVEGHKFKLTKGAIVDRINDILKLNQVKQVKQFIQLEMEFA